MGRPPKYDEDQLAEINKALNTYIDQTDIPIVSEFSYQNDIRYQRLYELFPETIKRLIEKKAANLERKSLNGEINVTQAIFSLKQLGWKDRPDDVPDPTRPKFPFEDASTNELRSKTKTKRFAG